MNTMRSLLTRLVALPVGTNIAAAADFGPVIKGQWGIIIGRQASSTLLWRQTTYVCTFLGGVRVIATRAQIAAVQHGRSLRALEDPFWFLHSRGLADQPFQHEVEVLRYISRMQ